MQPIVLDGRPLQGGSRFRGIGTYARELLRGLGESSYRNDIRLLVGARNGALSTEDASLAPPLDVRIPTMKARLQPLADPLLMTRILGKVQPSLYHSLEYAQPLAASCPVVVTVYDLIPFLYPAWYPWLRRERLLALQLLKRADALISISEATASDLRKHAGVDPAKIHVIPLGVSPRFMPLPQDDAHRILEHLHLGRPFLLAVGTFDPRKRIDLLCQVTNAVRKEFDCDLVIVGQQGNFHRKVVDTVHQAGLDGHTHLLGHVSDEILCALYSATACVVFPSEYEGFGLPVLEALASGSPVAAFATSSLPEIAGPVAIMTEQYDTRGMARSILELLSSPALRSERVAAGIAHAGTFTWERTISQTIAVYRSLL